MITIPEHHIQHEMVLGDPRECTYSRQSTVPLDRIHEILLLADRKVPGRAPSDLKVPLQGLLSRKKLNALWQLVSEAAHQIRRIINQRSCLSSLCAERARGGSRSQHTNSEVLKWELRPVGLATRSRRYHASKSASRRSTDICVRAVNDAEADFEEVVLNGGVKDEPHEVLEHAQAHSMELVDGEYLQRN